VVAAIATLLVAALACARSSNPVVPPDQAAAPPPAPPAPAAPGGPAPSPAAPREPAPSQAPAPAAPGSVEGHPPAPRAPVPPAEILFTDLAGIRRELGVLRAQGRPVLVNFWATWCGACAHELPMLADMAREWGDDGPAILGVSLDRLTVEADDPVLGKVRTMLATHRVSYPNRIVRGEQSAVFDAFGIAGGLPHSVFYDARGSVVRSFTGAVGADDVREVARSLRAGG
jgi:thiol-disulfide isomerase/thioredoxin